ncbi:NADPH-dependent FMN reductase [Streptomyces telluris]|uniref:NAD(P)H-dependent oxidoreductase n=1 Tax=Streptomyces telluris TaxID=2720021 RepID=A0A9X2LK92_9ACTN|nr:NADPH-dependent FMN reductase [Streptomyces telluris]MCQ8772720.1 NAD(P)H-dependent oxidoreductase [Streptomyces telluris]NJP80227.1 NAD(P)H-dependent oxidoreductase [Streptomyces telluris]
MTKVVLISGSLRAASVNSAALRAARRIIGRTRPAASVVSLPIGRLPFYNGDMEGTGATPAVAAARALVAGADALMISTPCYNGAVPGVLKNALDWLSRPDGASPLTGRVAAVLSASPGGRGGIDAQPALFDLLDSCEAITVEHPPVAIRWAHQRLDAAGEMTEGEAVRALRELVDATFEAVAIMEEQRRSVREQERELHARVREESAPVGEASRQPVREEAGRPVADGAGPVRAPRGPVRAAHGTVPPAAPQRAADAPSRASVTSSRS